MGGGWAGFAAALALAKAGAEVTLLDASETPGGLSSAFTTPGGQMVEPGMKGFWYQVGGGTQQGACQAGVLSSRQQQHLTAIIAASDASESPGGLSSAFTTPGGQMVEPGIKGFRYQA